MKEGDTYYRVQLDAAKVSWEVQKAMKEGRDKLFTAVFINTQKKSDNEPIFKNDWIAIWEAKKRNNVQTEKVG